ncbi:MAG: replication initiator protein A [Halanaerobiales bacterium]|nr:replication initiator protein A [Halanaerobiales bacterium]
MSNRKVYKIYEVNRHKFYQVPKQLFTSSYYRDLSSNAKLLYGILLDRLELSKKNNWVNDKGEVFLILRREEVQDLLCISGKTATKTFKELKSKKLIYEERQGLNKPNIIFVGKINYKRSEKSGTARNRNFYGSGTGNSTGQEPEKLRPSNTDLNNTYKEEEEGHQQKNSENFSKQTAKLFFQVFERQIKNYEIKQLLAYNLPDKVIQKAIELTGRYNGDTFAYIRRILDNWTKQGINTLQEVKDIINKHEQFKQGQEYVSPERELEELYKAGYR